MHRVKKLLTTHGHGMKIKNRFKRVRETDGIMKILDKKCVFNVLSSNLDMNSSGIKDL